MIKNEFAIVAYDHLDKDSGISFFNEDQMGFGMNYNDECVAQYFEKEIEELIKETLTGEKYAESYNVAIRIQYRGTQQATLLPEDEEDSFVHPYTYDNSGLSLVSLDVLSYKIYDSGHHSLLLCKFTKNGKEQTLEILDKTQYQSAWSPQLKPEHKESVSKSIDRFNDGKDGEFIAVLYSDFYVDYEADDSWYGGKFDVWSSIESVIWNDNHDDLSDSTEDEIKAKHEILTSDTYNKSQRASNDFDEEDLPL